MKIHFHYTLPKNVEDEWDEFWHNSSHNHPQHHLNYGKIERAKGNVPVYVYGRHNNSINCIGIFSIRPLLWGNRFSFEATCLRGPVFDDTNYLEDMLLQIITYFKSIKVGCIRISPYWFIPEADKIESILDELGFIHVSFNSRIIHRLQNKKWTSTRPTSVIDLQKSHKEIYTSFFKRGRRMIKKARQLNVKIHTVHNLTEARIFYDNHVEMCNERGINAKSYPEFKSLFENFLQNGELGTCLIANFDNIFLGGLWLIRGTRYAHAIQAVISRKQLNKIGMHSVSIIPLLDWHGISWAKEKGCRYYDLEGPSEGVSEMHPMFGVLKSKKQLNPLNVERIHDHVYICNRYIDALNESKKIMSQGFRFSKKMLSKLIKKSN